MGYNALVGTLLLILGLLVRGAAAETELYGALASEADPGRRAELIRALNRASHRGERSLRTAAELMRSDLSPAVREAAAAAVLSYEGARPVELVAEMLQEEQGEAVRAAVCRALGASAAQRGNPLATSLLERRLAEDPGAPVRLAAVAALQERGDRRALGALKRAADKDPEPAVRRAAHAAHATLAKPPPPPEKILPKPEGSFDSVKGRDKCGRGHGWCECAKDAVTVRPRCMTQDECRHRYDSGFRHQGYVCTWDSQNLE